MSGFFVLDVPEFAPILEAARALKNCKVNPARAGYVFVEFSGEVVIERHRASMSEAVWFGCMTGGLEGKIISFDAAQIRLASI
jgi:hypothetical protein